jgi:3-mercaptopyruvate sulfurtransferase SseA
MTQAAAGATTPRILEDIIGAVQSARRAMMASVTSAQLDDVPEISREELTAALRRGRVALVDVLPHESFAARHIPGAISLPLAEIPDRVSAVLPDRNAAIVVYCGGPT